MLRKTLVQLLVRAAFICSDVFLVTAVYFSLYLYRISNEFGFQTNFHNIFDPGFWTVLPYFSGYLRIYIVVIVVSIFFLQRYSLYDTSISESLPDQFWKIIKASLYTVTVIAFISYLFRLQLFSRLVFISFTFAIIFMLWFWRVIKHFIILNLLKKGRLLKKLLIVGAGNVGTMVAGEISQRPSLGYKIIGYVDDDPQKIGRHIQGVCVLGSSAGIEEIVKKNQVDEVLITIPSERELTNRIITKLRRCNLQIRIVPEMFNLMTSAVEVGQLGPVPYMRIVRTPMQGVPFVAKRIFDVIVSLLAIIVLSPIMLVTALAVRLDSPGPIIFKQKRVGKNGDLFDFYKFRSMVANAEILRQELAAANEADGPVFKIKADPRITKVGKFIRKYSIDELPQLFNVIKGDMSLVGPRPPLSGEVDRYGDIEWRRLEVVPGITGLWQVSGRSEVSFNKWMELDIYYIENWSIWLDLKILLQTIPVVLTGKGAY